LKPNNLGMCDLYSIVENLLQFETLCISSCSVESTHPWKEETYYSSKVKYAFLTCKYNNIQPFQCLKTKDIPKEMSFTIHRDASLCKSRTPHFWENSPCQIFFFSYTDLIPPFQDNSNSLKIFPCEICCSPTYRTHLTLPEWSNLQNEVSLEPKWNSEWGSL